MKHCMSLMLSIVRTSFLLVTICKIVLDFSRFFAFLLFKTCYASPNWVSYQLVLIDAHKRLEARFRHQSFVSNERQFWNTFQVVFLRFHPWKLVELSFQISLCKNLNFWRGKTKAKYRCYLHDVFHIFSPLKTIFKVAIHFQCSCG